MLLEKDIESRVLLIDNNTKSILIIGNLNISNTKRFSWFHRLMWKIILGIEVKNV